MYVKRWSPAVSWPLVILLFLTLGLAPYNPPDVVEKIRMIVNGRPLRAADWFGLLLHGSPWVLLLVKAYFSMKPPRPGTGNVNDFPAPPASPVKLYALSTCFSCKRVKKLLADCSVQFEFQDVDLLPGPQQDALMEEVKKINPRCSFPTIVIGETVIVGFKEGEIRKALGLK